MVRAVLLVGLVLLGQPALAHARGALSLGPALRIGPGEKPDAVGMRGGVEGQYVLVAVERYESDAEVRTRGELALRVGIPLGLGVSVEPALGLMPYDRTQLQDGSTILCVSATAGLRFLTPLFGGLYLLAEPVRVERRLLKMTLPAAGGLPLMDDAGVVEYASTAALSYVW
jgi:hypothetical protein